MHCILAALVFLFQVHVFAHSKPNIILIVADDLGHNDVGWANNRTITPHLDDLVTTGMELSQFYVFKYCAPSRGALMSGRYPFHFGFYTNQDANDYGLPTNFTMLPAVLREYGGYRTHMIGKWHLGFRNETLTPTFRGYDTFLGYYHMGEDYYTHKQKVKGGNICKGEFLDFSNNSGAHINPLWPTQPIDNMCNSAIFLNNTCIHAYNNNIRNLTTSSSVLCCVACSQTYACQSWNWNHNQLCSLKSDHGSPNPGKTQCDAGYKSIITDGEYSAFVFAKEAKRLIERHASMYKNQPLFLYLPFQSVHGPLEVPMIFEELYNHTIHDKSRRTHQGMVTALDQAIGNITTVLKNTNLYNNSIIFFTSDNGGPLPASNNYPLRGGKFTDWEGGTRVRAFIHSPLLPSARIGTVYQGLMHATDVFPTLLSAANITMPNNTGPVAMDGIDMWHTLKQSSPSLRNEILYAPINQYNPEDCIKWGQNCGGAIRVGDFKLVVGYPGDSRWLTLPKSEKQASSIPMPTEEGGPGPDGCNLTTGVKCPCHHLNGGPCLFDVQHDKEEKHDLSHDPQYKDLLAKLMKRFTEVSQTGVKQAGLIGPVREADFEVKCAFLNRTHAFEPYGSDIPWIWS